LAEENRLKLVEEIRSHSITWLDASLLKDEVLQQIFTRDELSDYAEGFHKEWLGDLPASLTKCVGDSHRMMK
jgi:hypothetical protein